MTGPRPSDMPAVDTAVGGIITAEAREGAAGRRTTPHDIATTMTVAAGDKPAWQLTCEQLAALLPDALVWCVDARSGTVAFVSSRAQELYGGASVVDSVVPEDRGLVLDILADPAPPGAGDGVVAVTLRRHRKGTGSVTLSSRWQCQVSAVVMRLCCLCMIRDRGAVCRVVPGCP
jgi:hypothetical protein